jgi:CDP-diacylglycerol--serine O-phosphatidyltransferase
MVREFHLADFFTLGNAACGVGAVLLVMDRVVTWVETDFSLWRLVWAFGAVLLLLFGLVWEED